MSRSASCVRSRSSRGTVDGARCDGSLDLPLATLSRAAFTGSRADEVESDGLRAEHVDLRGLDTATFTRPDTLRGTTLSEGQVAALAVPLALALGIDVRD